MKKLLLIPTMALALLGFVTSCDLPDTELHIASGSFMTHVTQVSFINETSDEAAGKLLNELDGTEVEISGPDKDKVYNIEGEKEFKIQGGSLLLLLDPNIDFVGEETYTVNLIIKHEDYLERNVPVTFIKDENNGSVEVALVKLDAIQTNEKVTLKNATGTIDSTTKTLLNEIVLEADNDQGELAGITTEITVPKGIQMTRVTKNANGKEETEILEGELKAEVISFTETDEGTAFFPGGLMPENINMEAHPDPNAENSGAFISAGFTAVNMTVGGKRVTHFKGKKVQIKMNLGENTFNPQTNAPYKLGDTVDVWSYETENGQWKWEKTGEVVDDNGRLCVMFETSHLSYFNLDYLAAGNKGRCYTSKLKINWKGLDRVNQINSRFTLKYVGGAQTNNWWKQTVITKNSKIYDGKEITLYNAPRLPIEITVYDVDNKKELKRKTFKEGEICSGGASITIDAAPPVKKDLVTISFKGLCDGSKVFPPVGTRLFYKLKTDPESAYKEFHYVDYLSRFDETITTDKLDVNATYTFKVYAGSTPKTYDLDVSKVDLSVEIKIPDDICIALTK